MIANLSSVCNMGLKNKDGVDMKEVWNDGVLTYLGMTVHGFPNTFMVYSPQGIFSHLTRETGN
jgi:cation diffusion facilitator CzcD-associated flavoprotein CzcO